MKFIKKIISTFLILVLINLITILAISYNLKETLVNGLIKEVIQENIKTIDNNYIGENSENLKNIDDSKLQELLDSQEIQDLLEKYMDITIDGISDEQNLDNISIEQDVLDYLKKNKEELSDIFGENITNEMIDQAKEKFDSKESSKIFKETIQNTEKNLTKSEKFILNCYKFFISKAFKIVLVALIVFDLLLLALLQQSAYKWLNSFAVATLISGVMLIIISFTTETIVRKVSGLEGFHINNLQTTGIVISICGLLIVLIYKVTTSLVNKSKRTT